MSVLTVLRFALAIAFDALAFIVWDLGTRAPLTLLRDVGRGLLVPRSLLRGALRLLLGGALLITAGIVIRPLMPSGHVFVIVETGMLIVALLVEQLIGNDLRGTALGKS